MLTDCAWIVGQGDPLTPGWPSTPGGPRLDLAQAYDEDDPKMKGYSTLPKIPVQPLSWADALPLLAGLQGQLPSESWRGGIS
jgi:N-acetylated-alpha-linked acidic dipeptidase